MSTPSAERHFQVYAFLAAAGALSRTELGILINEPVSPNVLWTTWLYAPLAILVLLRPWDLRILLAMWVAQLVDLWNVLPMSPNHWLLTGVVGASWLVVTARLALRDGRLPTGGELVQAATPAFRVAIAIFYVFTGFWKTNTAFLDPAHSCGVSSWHRLAVQFGLPEGTPIALGVIGFTLALEYGVGVLLLMRQTRQHTAWFLAFFHATLALDLIQNYQNFSWTMFPLLWLFVEPETVDRFVGRVPRARALAGPIRAMWAGFYVVAAFVAALGGSMAFWQVRWAFAAPMAWAWTAVFGWMILPDPPPVLERPAGTRAAWVLLALVLLNGTAPILGLKNRNSWQMYSNVRLEADASNHLLLGRSLDLLGYESDLVEILETSDGDLAKDLVGTGLKLTWHDLRVRLGREPGATVTYRRNGGPPVHAVAGEDPELAPPPLLSRKLVWFRYVGPKVAEQCVW